MQYPNFKIILFDFPNKTKMDFYIRMTQQKNKQQIVIIIYCLYFPRKKEEYLLFTYFILIIPLKTIDLPPPKNIS